MLVAESILISPIVHVYVLHQLLQRLRSVSTPTRFDAEYAAVVTATTLKVVRLMSFAVR